MDNDVAMPQTNGATNKIPPSLQNTFLQPPTIDFFQETQPPNCHPSYTASSVSSWEKQQLPVIQNGESVNKQSSVQLSYNESHYQGCPLPAFSLCENQSFLYSSWDGCFLNMGSKLNASQVKPNSGIQPALTIIKQKPMAEEMQMDTKPNLCIGEETKNNKECPVCGRRFVYHLNYIKHLSSASCSQPPCKKTRADHDLETTSTVKSNTLPRPGRAKKTARSNSMKLKKKPTDFALENESLISQLDLAANSNSQNNFNVKSVQGQNFVHATPSCPVSDSLPDETMETVLLLSQQYCQLCQMKFTTGSSYQRHRLSHALVYQITRSVQQSLLNSSAESTVAFTSSSSDRVLLRDQARANFNDHNWLRRAVSEVERLLYDSNMDVDVRRRLGLEEDDVFQKVVDLLMSPEFNLNPSKCSDLTQFERKLIFNPELAASGMRAPAQPTAMCTSTTCHTFSTSSDSSCHNPLADVPVHSGYTSMAPFMADGGPSLDVRRHGDPEFDVVERQMTELLKPYELSCTECGRWFPQRDLLCHHMRFYHQMNIPLHHETLPSGNVTAESVLQFFDDNAASSRTLSVSETYDLLRNTLGLM